MLNQHDIAHPGVGSTGVNSDEPIQLHAYYQWVPYVLSFQALTFYIPHMIWKLKEGGRLKNLVAGLELAAYATDKNLNIGKFRTPTKSEINQKFRDLNLAFSKRLIVNKDWSKWLIICEFLNLFNIILQIILTNWFLDGAFLSLGPKLIKEHFDNNSDTFILDKVFPKMTKCTFHKYGASGTIQSHDAMCVLALNIINEKIYSFLWFWFLIILIVSVCALIWRAVTALFGRSRQLNALIYSMEYSKEMNPWRIVKAAKRSDYLDWLFLTYVSKNMNPLVFKTFISQLAKEWEEMELIPNLLDEENSLDSEDYKDNKLRYIDDDSFGTMNKKQY